MTKEGKYIYAIVSGREPKNFGSTGMGGQDKSVYMINHMDLWAVISDSPIDKYPVSRINTMAHQRVMEEAMRHYATLPVRFGTIAEDLDQIEKKLLHARYDELMGLLSYMEDKIELGLKALWKDKDSIFQEIVDENRQIRVLRDRLLAKKKFPQHLQVELGEMVKKALDEKRAQEEKGILDAFRGMWVDRRENRVFGDQMVTNSAFLVTKDLEMDFDRAVDELASAFSERLLFKYIGPVPPCNFVEIQVKW